MVTLEDLQKQIDDLREALNSTLERLEEAEIKAPIKFTDLEVDSFDTDSFDEEDETSDDDYKEDALSEELI